MKNFLLALPLASMLLLSCASTDRGARSRVRPLEELQTVVRPEPEGRLVVRTDTVEFEEEAFTYYLHRPYEVYDEEGELVLRVSNSLGDYDETPSKVRLAPARYVLRVPTERSGTVEFETTVAAGAVTTIDASTHSLVRNGLLQAD